MANNYKTNNENNSPITQRGLLNINRQTEMNDFDVLVATQVTPKPKYLLTPNDIVQRMIDKKFYTYFQTNKKYKILTVEDDAIQLQLDNAEKKSTS